MARIANLPQKFQEIGRLRAGKKSEDPKRPMEALDSWRFTSPNELAIKAIASIYGGDPHPWKDREDEWEVMSESDVIEVQLPGDPIFTAYEMWGQGGNQRRCDGERCVVPVQDPQGGHLDEKPCICDEQDLIPGESKNACSVTVRLKVVLPNVPGIGIWMLTSGSIYAAMELPAVCDLIDALRQRSGILIPCRLELQYREEKRAYEKFKRQYHVPTLLIEDSVQRITRKIQQIEQGPSITPTRELPMYSSVEEQLLAHRVIDDKTGCWRWSSGTTREGYGHVKIGGKDHLVHRIAYEVWVGTLESRMEIDHVYDKGCRYRDCFNPEHLEQVTSQENQRRRAAGKPALPTGTEARSPAPDSPPGRREPSRGPGEGMPPLSRSYTLAELRELCRANDLPTDGVAQECASRLHSAGVQL